MFGHVKLWNPVYKALTSLKLLYNKNANIQSFIQKPCRLFCNFAYLHTPTISFKYLYGKMQNVYGKMQNEVTLLFTLVHASTLKYQDYKQAI